MNNAVRYPEDEIPALAAGDYMTRPEFERRYHAHPELKKAELIEGIVYLPSPVRADKHGDPHFDMIGWLGFYRMTTPGIRGSDNATIRFDFINEPQPDVLLRLDPALGGNSWIDGDGYLQGAPELVVEVATSSTSYDLHQKKATYARHGVQEYLVLQANEIARIFKGCANLLQNGNRHHGCIGAGVDKSRQWCANTTAL